MYCFVAYVHVDKSRRDKLDLSAKNGIFIDYRMINKQYRIIDPKIGFIIESSHEIFKENQMGGSILESADDSHLWQITDEIC